MDNIKWVGANSNNYGIGRSGKKINKIILHWIVGTLESADATFNSPTRYASSHYGIGDDDIHQYVREEDTAWHASNLTVNRESIGIEHEGGWLKDGQRVKPSEQTHQTSAKLVADICKRYNIPIDDQHILPHKNYSNTQCPGTLDISRIIQLAKEVSFPPPDDDMITSSTKIPKDLLAGEHYKPENDVEVQAIRSQLNDQTKTIGDQKKRIRELEETVQQPIPPAFSKPKAIHFNELAKLEEAS